jgi:hypothetical protein
MADKPAISNAEVKKYDEIDSRSYEQAVAESDAACAWVSNYSLKFDLPHLGVGINKRYCDIRNSTQEPDNLSRYAIKWFWIVRRKTELSWNMVEAADHTSGVFKEIMEGFGGDEIGEYITCTFIGIYTNLDLPKLSGIDRVSLFKGISLHWFCKADELMREGNALVALNAINNAFTALLLSQSDLMEEQYRKKAEADKSDIARARAKLRHAKTYEIRQQVIDYWHEYIYPDNPKLSNEDIGDWLHNTFPDVSIRTLVEYIADAKKKLKKIPPAGTA